MEVVPAAVGGTSRRWDDEHLDLQSASDGIGEAPTSGFTDAVAPHAVQFTQAWSRFAADRGDACEARADSLRSSIADFLETDDATYADLVVLTGFLSEVR